MTRHLLIIDPQNDFCDIPEAALPSSPAGIPRPALPVPGAHADMQRLAAFIRHRGPLIDEITVTLDTHSPADIAHPAWWTNGAAHPTPFTVITVEDVQTGKWRTTDPEHQARALDYVQALASGGKYALVIWPEHCLGGSWGHNIHQEVKEALDAWAREHLKPVHLVFKGMNPATEHYSAVRAEVPDPLDPETVFNQRLIDRLQAADEVLVAGEALSHCVASTVRDIANAPGYPVGRLTLLTDAASSVGGFEQLGKQFVQELTQAGMKSARTTGVN